jgi:single-stranded DNA-binding protein
MNSFNRVILLGNLTRDPEVRYIPSGTAVASFAIAVNRRYKQGDEMKDEVSYIDIVVFGKTAENCGQYLNKGDAILVEGRLQQRRWDDKDSVRLKPRRGAGGYAERVIGFTSSPEGHAGAGKSTPALRAQGGGNGSPRATKFCRTHADKKSFVAME